MNERVAGFNWTNQHYQLKSSAQDDIWAEEILLGAGVYPNNLVLGFNIGSSVRQKRKRWSLEKFIVLANTLNSKRPDWKIVILAGPDESDIYEEFLFYHKRNSLNNLVFAGCSNNISQFISLIKRISLIVSCDTFGMHAAIALGKKVVSLHGPQPIQEVTLYGNGKKIRNKLDCMPCFLTQKNCSSHCMQIDPCVVETAINELLCS